MTKRLRRLGGWIAVSVAAVVLPFLLPSYYLYILSLGLVWAIAAIGLNLLTGYTGQISIGHAGFVAIGAYVSALVSLHWKLPFWVTLPLAGLTAGVAGYMLGMPALRLSGPYLAIATLGFGVAVSQVIAKWEAVTGGFQGLKLPRPSSGLTLNSEVSLYFLTLVILALMMFVAENVLASRIGRAFIALRDSEPAAQSAGISLPHYKTLAFALSAFYAGVAGSVYAHLVGFITPSDFDLLLSIFLVSVIVVGGLASIPGSVLGAVFLTVLFQFLSSARDLRTVIYGAVLIAVSIFLPGGLWRLPAVLATRRQPKGAPIAEGARETEGSAHAAS